MKDEKTESLIAIDPDRLDEEWVGQPALFYRYAARLANAKRMVDEMKAEMTVVEADLARKIRTDPGSYGVEKITESAVREALVLQPDYTTANEAVIEARHAAELYGAAVTALDHRKKALENLVYLHGQSYFATPQPREGDQDAVERVKDRAFQRRVKIGRPANKGTEE
jgi:hypothetical protein